MTLLHLRIPLYVITILVVGWLPCGIVCLSQTTKVLPTWSELDQITGRRNNRDQPPICIDHTLLGKSKKGDEVENSIDLRRPRLYRERNGWCIYSERLWLALELKGITTNYETHLIDAIGDTYDGSIDDDDRALLLRPDILIGKKLPQLLLPPQENGDEYQLHDGSTETSSLELLKQLDNLFPDSIPLWPPIHPISGKRLCSEDDVSMVAEAFSNTAVPSSTETRMSSRAAYLFCYEEGYRLDTLPISKFESFLDTAESILVTQKEKRLQDSDSDGDDSLVGPFFCGTTLPSAADIVWAPLLERYAIQLPCLLGIDNINPRYNENRWPNLQQWYNAMDQQLPVYKCRIKGDGQSWRKVLFVDPWWPSADIWHPRDTVGPKGELKLTDEEVYSYFGDIDNQIDDKLWKEYCSTRPYVASEGPKMEAAATLTRNNKAIAKDAVRWIEENEYDNSQIPSMGDIDKALRCIVALLTEATSDSRHTDDETTQQYGVDYVPLVLRYLDQRM